MSKSKTPTFIGEIPLSVSALDSSCLLARLEAGRQLYNACLGEAVRRVRLIQQSKLYQRAKALPKTIGKQNNSARTEAFKSAWIFYDFSEYGLHGFATKIRDSWIAEHLDADTAQKLATRAFGAAKRVLLGQAKRVRFKGKNQLDSLEGKSGRSPMKWKDGKFVWMGLELDPHITGNDPTILHALNSPVKYVRLVRRKIRGQNLFYTQLVCEGKPFQKPKNTIGEEVVGLDIGPSTVAVVGETQAWLQPFCPEIRDASQEIARLQRQMSRQQRANNPDCYEPSRCDLPKPGQKHGKRKLGKSIKNKRHHTQSRRYAKVRRRKAEVERKLAAYRKSLHNGLVNQVLSVGKCLKLEKLSYKAFQRMFGRSVGKRAPGLFVSQLKQKAENAGGDVHEFPTRDTKLSQRCVCGRIQKKSLSQRVHACECGVHAQRDLFSAYLARHVDVTDCFQADSAKQHYQGAESLLRSAWERADKRHLSSGGHIQMNIGCRFQYIQASIGSLRVVSVVTAAAPETLDPEALRVTDETPDGVGLDPRAGES